MREITAAEAERDFGSILKEVEDGETILVSREGKAIARMTPVASPRYDSAEAKRALAKLAQIRARSSPVTIEEVLAWRDEGRK
jgi:prevent-host-death family protein